MKKLAFDVMFLGKPVFSAVFHIPHNRMSYSRQMGADLMGLSRNQVYG